MRSVAFTAVGDDTVGDFVLRYLRDEGVATDFIQRKAGKRTSLAMVGVQPPDSFPLNSYRDDPRTFISPSTTRHFSRLPRPRRSSSGGCVR